MEQNSGMTAETLPPGFEILEPQDAPPPAARGTKVLLFAFVRAKVEALAGRKWLPVRCPSVEEAERLRCGLLQTRGRKHPYTTIRQGTVLWVIRRNENGDAAVPEPVDGRRGKPRRLTTGNERRAAISAGQKARWIARKATRQVEPEVGGTVLPHTARSTEEAEAMAVALRRAGRSIRVQGCLVIEVADPLGGLRRATSLVPISETKTA